MPVLQLNLWQRQLHNRLLKLCQPKSPDLEILGTSVRYLKDADLLIFEQIVKNGWQNTAQT